MTRPTLSIMRSASRLNDMSAAAIYRALVPALRRALVLLAALSFVVSGVSSLHTAHAMAGGHDVIGGHDATGGHDGAHAAPHAAADCHVANDVAANDVAANDGAGDTQPEPSFACCAVACAPLMVLTQAPSFAAPVDHGPAFIAAPPPQVVSRALAGPFRPPRRNA